MFENETLQIACLPNLFTHGVHEHRCQWHCSCFLGYFPRVVQLPANTLKVCVPLLIVYCRAESRVVHSYAACALEKLFTVKGADGTTVYVKSLVLKRYRYNLKPSWSNSCVPVCHLKQTLKASGLSLFTKSTCCFLDSLKKEDVGAHCEQLLLNLFGGLSIPGSEDNEYFMKGTSSLLLFTFNATVRCFSNVVKELFMRQ